MEKLVRIFQILHFVLNNSDQIKTLDLGFGSSAVAAQSILAYLDHPFQTNGLNLYTSYAHLNKR